MSDAALLPESLRDEFPLLARRSTPDRPLIYLDSAATALKPRSVIAAITDVLEAHTANVHRASHVLGDEATELFEQARRKVASFINAEPHEVILVRNTTEALNLIAASFPRRGRTLVSLSEHHSNLLPWGNDDVQRLPPKVDGSLDTESLSRELARGGVGLVAIAHVSNVTGVRADTRRLADAVHKAGAVLVVDGAQSVPHGETDVQELDCDFLAFSAHKLGGPTGVGALYGKAERLAELRPYQKGGGTVEHYTAEGSVGRQPPWLFEAGTPAIEATVGFGAAVDFLREVGPQRVEAHCRALCRLAKQRLRSMRGVQILGPAVDGEDSVGPVSFTVDGFPAHLIARGLSDSANVCVRSGFHCAQPLHAALRSPASVRLSFYLYNQPRELDRCFEALDRLLAAGGKAW
jgi:cysteine desulfurase / selenocysteine lyase